MAGAYCRYCDRRCFVERAVRVGGQTVWRGHMATCRRGMEHDRASLGRDASTAVNPVLVGRVIDTLSQRLDDGGDGDEVRRLDSEGRWEVAVERLVRCLAGAGIAVSGDEHDNLAAVCRQLGVALPRLSVDS